LTPLTTRHSAPSANHNLLRLQRAAFKIVYRLRADRRIQALKRADHSTQPSKAIETIVGEDSKEKVKITVPPKPIIRYMPHRKVPIEIPPAPEIFQPRPINLIVPSYAERMGYEPLPIPQAPLVLRVPPPRELDHSGTDI
jgi:hypothetical protein